MERKGVCENETKKAKRKFVKTLYFSINGIPHGRGPSEKASVVTSGYQLGYNTNAPVIMIIFPQPGAKGKLPSPCPFPSGWGATDEDMDNLKISLLETNDFQQIEGAGQRDYTTVDYYLLKSWKPRSWPRTWAISRKGNIKAYPFLPMCQGCTAGVTTASRYSGVGRGFG